MKATGIVRRIDELGRIVIPKELRKTLNIIDNETSLEIFTEGDTVILKPYEPSCFVCGEAENLEEINGKKLCLDCCKKYARRFKDR